MGEAIRQQRWLLWKNIDTTETPTCPAFGCIEIVGFEFIGASLVLLGRSATCFEREPNIEVTVSEDVVTITPKDNDQGALWNHAFNNEVDVPFGKIGKCTFDLPTWVLFVGISSSAVGGDTLYFGDQLTCGNFAVQGGWIGIPYDPGFNGRIPLLGTTRMRTIGKPWHVGPPNADLYRNNEAGWNALHVRRTYSPPDNAGQVLIGGARTFLRSANSSQG